MRGRTVIKLGGLVAAFIIAVIVLVISIAGGQDLEQSDVGFLGVLLGGLAVYQALGIVIVQRADGHRVGWLLSTSAAMVAVVFACWVSSFAIVDRDGPLALAGWLNLTGSILFMPAMILLIPAVALVFPTGSLPGPRWRGAVWLIVTIGVIGSVAVLIAPGQEGGPPNPVGDRFPWPASGPPEALSVLTGLGTLAIALAFVLGVVAIATRFRSSDGVQRAQLKWLLAAALPAAILIPLSLSDLGSIIPYIDVISSASLLLVALAVALAILRYRLYEIDRVISRTIGWAIVTGLLVGTFALLVVGLQAVIEPLTGGNTLAIAGSTLVVAALFAPVRSRVQRAVDRRFDRSRYDGERLLADFGERLRDEVDLATLAGDLQRTANVAVKPASTNVWLRGPGGAR